jgi:hypothetical protein
MVPSITTIRIFSVVILSLAALIILRPTPIARPVHLPRYGLTRHFTDAKGVDYDYTFSTPHGVGLSLLIGWRFVGGLMSIGSSTTPARPGLGSYRDVLA